MPGRRQQAAVPQGEAGRPGRPAVADDQYLPRPGVRAVGQKPRPDAWGVGVVPRGPAPAEAHGVHRPADGSRRVQLIQQGQDCLLQRHGDVAAVPGPGPGRRQELRQGVRGHGDGLIAARQSRPVQHPPVQQGGQAVPHRVADDAEPHTRGPPPASRSMASIYPRKPWPTIWARQAGAVTEIRRKDSRRLMLLRWTSIAGTLTASRAS